MRTQTGDFPIYFRRGWSDWQKDLAALSRWAQQAGFEGLDLGVYSEANAVALRAAGLGLGTVDLLRFDKIAAADAGVRAEVRAANLQYIDSSVSAGARRFFTIVGGEPGRSRAENYAAAVEAFSPLTERAAAAGAVLAVEGYPGSAPHYALLASTPETVRALLRDIPQGLGLNYDPSHLVRLGVDPVRFLREFLPHVVHVHAKDTQLFPEAVYEFGLYQPAAFAKPHGFGQHAWRYCIPGQGQVPWKSVLELLHAGGYRGAISVELEDETFNGSEAGERAGLQQALRFLAR